MRMRDARAFSIAHAVRRRRRGRRRPATVSPPSSYSRVGPFAHGAASFNPFGIGHDGPLRDVYRRHRACHRRRHDGLGKCAAIPATETRTARNVATGNGRRRAQQAAGQASALSTRSLRGRERWPLQSPTGRLQRIAQSRSDVPEFPGTGISTIVKHLRRLRRHPAYRHRDREVHRRRRRDRHDRCGGHRRSGKRRHRRCGGCIRWRPVGAAESLLSATQIRTPVRARRSGSGQNEGDRAGRE